MDNGTHPDSAISTKRRGRPPTKNVDEQIEALAERMALLRKQKSQQQQQENAKLIQVIGTVIKAVANDNADPEFSRSVTRHLRERVTHSVQRALVERWLASLPK